MFQTSGGSLWFVIILMLLFLLFFSGAFQGLFQGFTKGVFPFTVPILVRTVTSFLLFSSKGSIGALGMLFLMAAFACRYINAYTPEQYEKLISSTAISCRISGSKHNAVYEEGDISGSFLENLRQFYQGYVK